METTAVMAKDIVRGDTVVFGANTTWTVTHVTQVPDSREVVAIGENSRGAKFALRRKPHQLVKLVS